MIVSIQHHPSRKRHLELLLKFLDLQNAEHHHIISDNINSASGMRKCLATARLHTHLMVIQDDVLPSKNLIRTANKLIKCQPDQFISLFSAYDITSNVLKAGKHWGIVDRAWGLPCYLIPGWMALDYLRFEYKIKDSVIADDVRMSIFLEHIGKMVYVTAPSLVEHLAFSSTTLGSGGSVKIENALQFRVAKNYIGFENSGLNIDWKEKMKDNIERLTIGSSLDHVRHLK